MRADMVSLNELDNTRNLFGWSSWNNEDSLPKPVLKLYNERVIIIMV